MLLVLACLMPATPSWADWANMYRFSERPEQVESPMLPQPGLPAPAYPAAGPSELNAGVPEIPALTGELVMPEALAAAPPAGMTAADAPMSGSTVAGDAALCLREILVAETRYGIPGHLLLAIGLQEAGTTEAGQLTVWPWSANAEGEGRMFADPVEAMNWVEERRRAGQTSIDVGCMQMNLQWHGEKFANLSDAFEPAMNVDVSARYLVELHGEFGDWGKAAGAYHSRDGDRQKIYLTSLEKNLAVATGNIAQFQALAGLAPEAPLLRPRRGAEETLLTAEVSPESETPIDPDHPLWSAGLGRDAEDKTERYGLYSRKSLQPVLPAFIKTF